MFSKRQRTDTINNNTKITEDIRMKDWSWNKDWIWVKGYKGTNKDMKSLNGKPIIQYELNKQFDTAGEIKLCSSGFHFSLNITDVFNYVPPCVGNRFFKIKALIPKELLSKYGTYCLTKGWCIDAPLDKLVAKSIIFEKELNYEDMKTEIEKWYLTKSPIVNFIHVNNKDLYNKLNSCNSFKDFIKEEFYNRMTSFNYSKTLITILMEEYNKNLICNDFKPIIHILEMAQAFKEENLSKDMSVYLLLKEINKNK